MMQKTVITQVIDHEEDNLSDKETYSKNIPAIGETKVSYIIFFNLLYSKKCHII